MITIQGLYDGLRIVTTQKIPSVNYSKVEITFLEEVTRSQEEEMEHYAKNSIFDFWANERDENDSDLSEK
jgi:hypothetical protein